jgi:iron complex transport system ATP-binding protein
MTWPQANPILPKSLSRLARMHQVVELLDVSVIRGNKAILDDVSWKINADEHWVVLGPNGAGKTTLMQILQTMIFPSSGIVEILGEYLGLVDVFELRPRIGLTSASMLDQFPDHETALDVVKTSAYSMTGTWREDYENADISRAKDLLAKWGIGHLGDRIFKSLSEGEKKRVLIARALMANPEVLLLDEPAAGLDIVGRESMVLELGDFAKSPTSPVCVLVTHHVEEIPEGFTHAICLNDGKVVAQGPIEQTLTDQYVSATFGLNLKVSRQQTSRGMRWSATLI